MNSDILQALRFGRLTEKLVIDEMITSIGAGVYAYMVMLNNAGRTEEGSFFEEIRESAFSIRNDFRDDNTPYLDERMRMVYVQLETARKYLSAHKPEEAGLLRSVANDACGLVHTLKHYTPTNGENNG